jgi:uncharacterized OB-fold protein
MKQCNFCNLSKPFSEFHKRNDRKNGLVSKCKDCSNQYKKKYRLANKEIIRAQNKRRVPGWDIVRYDEYLNLQEGKCAICGTTEYTNKDWCADHDHVTNEPRGLLCGRCNAGLGYFKDNPEYLQSAIDYLKKWQS